MLVSPELTTRGDTSKRRMEQNGKEPHRGPITTADLYAVLPGTLPKIVARAWVE